METQWISVKVHPRAKKDMLISIGPARFEAWVRAKPLDGRANEAVVSLLVRSLRISPQRIQLVKGQVGHHKVLKIFG